MTIIVRCSPNCDIPVNALHMTGLCSLLILLSIEIKLYIHFDQEIADRHNACTTYSQIFKYTIAIILCVTSLHWQCQVLIVGKLICMAAKCWIFPLRASPANAITLIL